MISYLATTWGRVDEGSSRLQGIQPVPWGQGQPGLPVVRPLPARLASDVRLIG